MEDKEKIGASTSDQNNSLAMLGEDIGTTFDILLSYLGLILVAAVPEIFAFSLLAAAISWLCLTVFSPIVGGVILALLFAVVWYSMHPALISFAGAMQKGETRRLVACLDAITPRRVGGTFALILWAKLPVIVASALLVAAVISGNGTAGASTTPPYALGHYASIKTELLPGISLILGMIGFVYVPRRCKAIVAYNAGKVSSISEAISIAKENFRAQSLWLGLSREHLRFFFAFMVYLVVALPILTFVTAPLAVLALFLGTIPGTAFNITFFTVVFATLADFLFTILTLHKGGSSFSLCKQVGAVFDHALPLALSVLKSSIVPLFLFGVATAVLSPQTYEMTLTGASGLKWMLFGLLLITSILLSAYLWIGLVKVSGKLSNHNSANLLSEVVEIKPVLLWRCFVLLLWSIWPALLFLIPCVGMFALRAVVGFYLGDEFYGAPGVENILMLISGSFGAIFMIVFGVVAMVVATLWVPKRIVSVFLAVTDNLTVSQARQMTKQLMFREKFMPLFTRPHVKSLLLTVTPKAILVVPIGIFALIAAVVASAINSKFIGQVLLQIVELPLAILLVAAYVVFCVKLKAEREL